MTNMNDLIAVTDRAAKDDRWFFIFVLFVGAVAFAWVLRNVARYFMGQHERLIADHRQDRERYQQSLQDNQEKLEGIAVSQQAVITKNTDIIERCLEKLERIAPVMLAGLALLLLPGCLRLNPETIKALSQDTNSVVIRVRTVYGTAEFYRNVKPE